MRTIKWKSAVVLSSFLVLPAVRAIDAEIVENSATRLTVDVVWGPVRSLPFIDAIDIGTRANFDDGARLSGTLNFAGYHAPTDSYTFSDNIFYLATDRTALNGEGEWTIAEGLGPAATRTGVFSPNPTFHYIDLSYPGMDVAPSPFASNPFASQYGGRFVFGQQYPAQPDVESVPEGDLAWALIPIGGAVAVVVRRRRSDRG